MLFSTLTQCFSASSPFLLPHPSPWVQEIAGTFCSGSSPHSPPPSLWCVLSVPNLVLFTGENGTCGHGSWRPFLFGLLLIGGQQVNKGSSVPLRLPCCLDWPPWSLAALSILCSCDTPRRFVLGREATRLKWQPRIPNKKIWKTVILERVPGPKSRI